MTATLQRKRYHDRCGPHEREKPGSAAEREDNANVTYKEEGHRPDVDKKIDPRAVIARVSLPLPAKEFGDAHRRCRLYRGCVEDSPQPNVEVNRRAQRVRLNLGLGRSVPSLGLPIRAR